MTLDDWAARAERHASWVRRAAWVVLAAALAAFLLRGADQPANPSFVGTGQRPLAGFGEAAFEIRTPEGRILDWCALLAATDAAREQGLMDQEDLRGYDGMLFRFDQPTDAQFYMFHTLIPLSIAFFDDTGTYVSQTDMPVCTATDPGSCPTYGATKDFVHALEVPKGGLARLGIGPGATMAITDGDCT